MSFAIPLVSAAARTRPTARSHAATPLCARNGSNIAAAQDTSPASRLRTRISDGWPLAAKRRGQYAASVLRAHRATSCSQSGVPSSCSVDCAEAYLPLWRNCRDELAGANPDFAPFAEKCTTAQQDGAVSQCGYTELTRDPQ